MMKTLSIVTHCDGFPRFSRAGVSWAAFLPSVDQLAPSSCLGMWSTFLSWMIWVVKRGRVLAR